MPSRMKIYGQNKKTQLLVYIVYISACTIVNV